LPQRVAKVAPPPECRADSTPHYHPDVSDSQELSYTIIGGAVCSHFYSPEEGTTMNLTGASISALPSQGSLQVGGLTWTYRPNARARGSDSFAIDVCGTSDYGTGCSHLTYSISFK
jgi:hypothetical protein